MSETPDRIDGLIPLGVAECCREWLVPIGTRGGSCGYCGEKPEFKRMLPESEWLRPRPPVRPEGWE